MPYCFDFTFPNAPAAPPCPHPIFFLPRFSCFPSFFLAQDFPSHCLAPAKNSSSWLSSRSSAARPFSSLWSFCLRCPSISFSHLAIAHRRHVRTSPDLTSVHITRTLKFKLLTVSEAIQTSFSRAPRLVPSEHTLSQGAFTPNTDSRKPGHPVLSLVVRQSIDAFVRIFFPT